MSNTYGTPVTIYTPTPEVKKIKLINQNLINYELENLLPKFGDCPT